MAFFKSLIILFLLFILTDANSASVEMNVLTRPKNNSSKPKIIKVALEDLKSLSEFDGEFFKIVQANSDKAIAIHGPDKDLVLKGASVYYHLTQAKNFWANKLGKNAVDKLKQVIIRLNVGEENLALVNATFTLREPDSLELWFGRPLAVNIDDLPDYRREMPIGDLFQYLGTSGTSIIFSNLQALTLEKILYPKYSVGNYWITGLVHVSAIALLNVAVAGAKFFDRLIADKRYFKDTAMIPESVYSLYSLLLLGRRVNGTMTYPAVRGMMDFFAAEIAGTKRLNKKLKGYTSSRIKSFFKNPQYQTLLEYDSLGQENFVFELLYSIKSAFKDNYFPLIFGAHHYFNSQSPTIHRELLESLLLSCEKYCRNPFTDKLKLYEIFGLKGL